MNRENAQKMLPIFTAFAEGKTIQFKTVNRDWLDTPCLYPDAGIYEYRVKPEAAYRAWTKDEVPIGKEVRSDGWRFLITGVHENKVFLNGGQAGHSFVRMFEEFKMPDSTPCGVPIT